MPGPISAKALPLGIPNTLVPIADRDGQCTQPWRYFFGSIGSAGAVGPPGPPGPPGPSGRTLLTTSVVYYVRTDGSNSNTGLINSPFGAFLTWQYAWDLVINTLDLGGNQVTIQAGNSGTFTSGISSQGDAQVGSGTIILQGFSSTPSDTLISTTSADCFAFNLSRVTVTIQGLKMQTASSGNALFGAGPGVRILFDNVEFGSCASSHMAFSHNCDVGGGSTYNVSGGAQFHIQNATQAIAALHGFTITFSNSPAFSLGVVFAESGGQIFMANMVFTNGNTVTGKRYSVSTLGYIDTGTAGGNVNYIPGNVAGTADLTTFGVYF